MGNNKNISRAMLLAAGLGTRLRPLTYEKPKPLFPVGGQPIIDYNLSFLKSAGIQDVVINLHHLGEMIQRHVGDGSRYGLKIEYSNEHKILGTGGGVKRVENFFQGEPFIVLNADTLIDIDLKELIKCHLDKKVLATMVVRKIKKGEDYTPLDVNDNRVVSIGKHGSFMFAGLQVINPEFLSILPSSEFSCLVENGYIPAIDKGEKIFAYEHKGYWADLGTIERYELVQSDFEKGIKFKFLPRV